MNERRVVGEVTFAGSRSNLEWKTTKLNRSLPGINEFSVAPRTQNRNTRSDFLLISLDDSLPSSNFDRHRAQRQQFGFTVAAMEDCSHPNLVQLVDYCVDASNCYAVMIHFESDSLQHWIRNSLIPSLPVALWITRQITQAVQALHHACWTHNAIDAASVRVSSTGNAILTDLFHAQPLQRNAANADLIAVAELLETMCESANLDLSNLDDLLARTKCNELDINSFIKEVKKLEMAAFSSQIVPKAA